MTDASVPRPRRRILAGVIPTYLYVGRAAAVLTRSSFAHRRAWATSLSGFVEPLLYLLALGAGLGSVIGSVPDELGRPVTYLAFVVPGLLAASTMNAAVYDTTMGIYYKLRHARLYESIVATPLAAGDVVLGELMWAALHGALYAAGFLAIVVLLGIVTTPWALVSIPAAFLVALGFGAMGLACTSFMRSWDDSMLVQLVMVPMLLFSTTFYPLSVYPEFLRPVVAALPLYQGIELMRGLVGGSPGINLLGPICYFLVMTAVGIVIATLRFDRILLR